MPNTLDSNGCTIASLTETTAQLVAGFQAIYGSDVNLNPNTPDGNIIAIFAQVITDLLEQLLAIYTSFDPDQAIGQQLDARCAINGVVRNPGTYTQQQISVTASGAATLQGLDLFPTNPFTVADGTGNQYQLLVTATIGSPGTTAFNFQAALLGAVQSAPNTITTLVTILPNILSVNNPTTYTTLGLNEETDAALRLRRANSVELPSQGYLQGLLGAIEDVVGVTSAAVFENDTSTTNAQGIPGHSIWCIVAVTDPTTALLDQIANAIYVKRNAGCGQTSTGYGAIATAAISGGGVSGFTVTNGGDGNYVLPPKVVITGGGGTGATGTAVLTAGSVTSITLTAAGTGYTSAPTVTLVGQTQAIPILQVDGSTFVILFDLPVAESVFFKATVDAIPGTSPVPDLTYIQNQVYAQFGQSYAPGETADTTSIVSFIKSIATNVVVSGEGVCVTSGGSYTPTLTPTAYNYQLGMASASNVILSS